MLCHLITQVVREQEFNTQWQKTKNKESGYILPLKAK